MTVGEFLRNRRARLTPEVAGIVSYGERRVPGLRREEVAMLAGVSVTYYTRLEQGQDIRASESVLAALARALRLTDVEKRHLHDLAAAAGTRRPVGDPRPDVARPGTLRLIENMAYVPCVLMGRRTELLGWNRLGHQLVGSHLPFEVFRHSATRPNMTRLLFQDAPTQALYPEWETEASRAVASLRLLSGRDTHDPELATLVGELTLQSPDFARLWNEQPVDSCMSGLKVVDHPRVGRVELDFEVLTMPDESGQRLLTYTAEQGSAAAAALRELAVPPPEPRRLRAVD